jgi:sulfur carrier protein
MSVPIHITLNGRDERLAAGTTVAQLVEGRYGTARGIAVAVGREIVPRSAWPAHEILEGDVLEVLGAAAGG